MAAECIDHFPILKVPPYKGGHESVGDMTRAKLARRTAIGLLVLAALYSAAWHVIADRLEDGVARWTAERRADGWTASYAALRLEGFPLSWQARIEEPELATQQTVPAIRWSGPAILLDWKPWNPSRIGFAAAGGHRLDLADPTTKSTSNLVFRQASGDLVFGGKGRLDRLSLAIDDADWGEQERERIRLNRLDMVLDTTPPPRTDPATQRPAEFHLTGSIHGLTLPESMKTPLGRTIGSLTLDATLMGKAGSGGILPALTDWRDDGGILEIDRFTLGWSRLVLDASGTFAFDIAMQPIIATQATLQGHNETLDALVGAGALAPGESLMARIAFRLLERSGGPGQPDEIRIALTVQEGWLYVGPVKLLRLPPIRWQRSSP